MKPFLTETYGKWILAGEHAVLRGCPAIAFPLTSRRLHLSYQASGEALKVDFQGPNGEELRLLFYGVLENALSRLNVVEPLKGHFTLDNTLPVGAGLGASAALCGAVSRWCQAQGWVAEDQIYEFARRLEDLFHGESSGVDLAVSLSGQGIRFIRGGGRTSLRPLWWPRLYLSYCGQRGMTSDCVARVKQLFVTNPPLAQALDGQMQEAVNCVEKALLSPRSEGFSLLKAGIEQAGDCFERWELCHGDLGQHLTLLKQAGACAVKPTGSGGGGYALSLWEKDLPPQLKETLVSIQQPSL